MKHSSQIETAKLLIQGFIKALSTTTLNNLFIQHQQEVNQRNIELVKEFRTKEYAAIHYFKHPAKNLHSFQSDYLPSIIILKLLNTNYNSLFSNINQQEIAYLMGYTTSLQNVVDIENSIKRLLKRPKNRHQLQSVLYTQRDIVADTDSNTSTF